MNTLNTEHTRYYIEKEHRNFYMEKYCRFTPSVKSSCDWAMKKICNICLPCLILYFPTQGVCITSKIQMIGKKKLVFKKR